MFKCDCGEDAVSQIVRKEGPNKGRSFYSCPSRSCKFFKWSTAPVAADTSSTTTKTSNSSLATKSLSGVNNNNWKTQSKDCSSDDDTTFNFGMDNSNSNKKSIARTSSS